MKVKLLVGYTAAGGVGYVAGETVEVTGEMGRALVQAGMAELIKSREVHGATVEATPEPALVPKAEKKKTRKRKGKKS